tara:strand:+ start:73 stop:690 length:618 start_codon:yes stop_codon:yes gene_type:complete
MSLSRTLEQIEETRIEYRERAQQHDSLLKALERSQQELSMLKKRHLELSEKFSELASQRLAELNLPSPIDTNLKTSNEESASSSSRKRNRVDPESVRGFVDETAAKCPRRRELRNLTISEKVNAFPPESPEARRLKDLVKKVSTGESEFFTKVSSPSNNTKSVCLEGVHRRPPGRTPKGKKWNEHLGMWVDDTDTCLSSSSSMGF